MKCKCYDDHICQYHIEQLKKSSVREMKRMYALKQWSASTGALITNEISLVEEIAILRVTLQEIMVSATNATALILVSTQITSLVQNIALCLEKASALDKKSAKKDVQKILQAISKIGLTHEQEERLKNELSD